MAAPRRSAVPLPAAPAAARPPRSHPAAPPRRWHRPPARAHPGGSPLAAARRRPRCAAREPTGRRAAAHRLRRPGAARRIAGPPCAARGSQGSGGGGAAGPVRAAEPALQAGAGTAAPRSPARSLALTRRWRSSNKFCISAMNFSHRGCANERRAARGGARR